MDLKYRILTDADLKGLRDTLKAQEDLKKVADKTTDALKKQSDEVRKSGKSMDDAGKQAKGFGDKLGKQIFGSLASFAIVTKAVQGIRRVFAPSLDETAKAAGRLTDGLGAFIAQTEIARQSSNGLAKALNDAAEAFEAMAAARQRFKFESVNTDLRVDASKAPAALRARFESFTAFEQQQLATEQRAVAGIDKQAEREIELAQARGQGSPQQIAAIRARASAQKAALSRQAEEQRAERLTAFRGQLPTAETFTGQISAFDEANAARASFARLQEDRENARRTVASLESASAMNPRARAATAQALFAARRSLASIESQMGPATALIDTRVQALRAAEAASGFPGVTSIAEAQQITGLGGQLFTSLAGQLRPSFAAGREMREGLIGEQRFSSVITPLQQQGFIDEQIKDVLEKQNASRQQELDLLRQGFDMSSAAVQALETKIRQLDSRIKELKNIAQ